MKEMLATRCSAAFRTLASSLAALGLLLAAAPAAKAQTCDVLQITDSAGTVAREPSLDAGRIAFASNADLTGGNADGNFEIFLWDGAAIEQVTDTAIGPLAAESGEPSLDGGLLAFTSNADLTGGNPDGNFEIFLWDGASFTQITDATAGHSFEPSLDGGSIAFTSTADLTGGNPDGSSEIFLWDGAAITQVTASADGSDQPSLQGGRIAFSSNGDLTGGNPEGNFEIFFWDGVTTVQVTDAAAGNSVQPSLDAALLAFTSLADLTGGNPDGSSEIFVWDGATILQLTDAAIPSQGSSEPSADAGTIAFRSSADLTGANPDLGGEIFLWDGGIVQVTDSPDPATVAFGPSLDAGSVAVWSDADFAGGNADGNFEIFLACPQGSSVLEVPALGPLGAALLALLLVAGGLWRLRATGPALLVVALLLAGFAGTAEATTPVTEGAPLLVGDNLLTNPGFASDLSAWDAVSSDAVETSWTAEDLLGRSDSGAMRVRNISDSAGHSVAFAGQCVPVMPGETYTFGGWTLAGAGQSYRGVFYQLRFRTNADCSGDTLALEALDVPAATAGRWHEAAREVVAPAGAMSASLRFLVRRASGDPADDVEVLFDELFILEGGATGCASDPRTACIGGRFAITVDYETTLGGGAAGAGTAVPHTSLGIDRGAIFWFFSPSNPELLIKVLDACSFSDHYWVFYSAGTNVGFDVRIVDVLTGNEWTSHNPDRTAAPPVQDTGALPCAVP